MVKELTFAERLKMLRKRKGLTQQQLAELLNISQPAYSHYEKGKNQPDIETLIHLAKIFEITLDELMGRNQEDKDPQQKEEIK